MNTIEQINQLAAERARLFQTAGKGGRGKSDAAVLTKIAVIGGELERLWGQRRAERAGFAEGIDRLIDSQYERLYGREDVPRVSKEELAGLAA